MVIVINYAYANITTFSPNHASMIDNGDMQARQRCNEASSINLMHAEGKPPGPSLQPMACHV